MGKMNLGLDDRSARLIHGRDVWTQIKDLLAGYNDIRAAIAYIGSDADQYLTLRGPATIVVNAGDAALASGATDPQVLLRWTRRGVRVHSLDSLHAKALLAVGNPSFVVIGSADVTSSSGRSFDEAVLVADENETVEELNGALQEWKRRAGEPLTEAWLQAASARFRPPVPHRAVPAEQPTVSVRAVVAPALPEPAAPQPEVPEPELPEPPVAAPDAEESGAVEPDVAELEGASDPEPSLSDSKSSVSDPESSASGPLPGIPAEPEPVADETPAPEAVEPQPEQLAEPEIEPEAGGEVEPVEWPRPKYIYLATLTQDGRASESALEQLAQLRSQYRAPSSTSRTAVLDVDVFWSEEAPRSSGRSRPTYRAGWHIVPISVPASGRPAVLSAVTSPGRVLHSHTEYAGGPARTYYYLLQHQAAPSTTFRKLREALTAVGEKPSYDHAYMMQHKVAAILDLWPEIDYSD